MTASDDALARTSRRWTIARLGTLFAFGITAVSRFVLGLRPFELAVGVLGLPMGRYALGQRAAWFSDPR